MQKLFLKTIVIVLCFFMCACLKLDAPQLEQFEGVYKGVRTSTLITKSGYYSSYAPPQTSIIVDTISIKVLIAQTEDKYYLQIQNIYSHDFFSLPMPASEQTSKFRLTSYYGEGFILGDGLKIHNYVERDSSATKIIHHIIDFVGGKNNRLIIPSVSTNLMVSTTTSSVTCGGIVSDMGNSMITDRGMCWNTSDVINHQKVSAGSGIGGFNCELTNLNNNTTYYVRAYAKNSFGTSYGKAVKFATKGIQYTPVVSTTLPLEVSSNYAVCGGNISNAGISPLLSRGFYWSTNPNPNLNNSKTSNEMTETIGEFTNIIRDLSPNTTYYVRAYATNKNGTAYGAVVRFTTAPVNSK